MLFCGASLSLTGALDCAVNMVNTAINALAGTALADPPNQGAILSCRIWFYTPKKVP